MPTLPSLPFNASWLDDFRVLSATGNFSRAAEERHMTQPAFSRRVRALEEWLGAELFDRSSQPARLTATGHWFGKVAQDLQVHIARIPGEARAVAEAGAATLRFAATHALSFTFLPRWLHALEAHMTVGPMQLVSDVQTRCEQLLLQSQVQFLLSHRHAGVKEPLSESGHPALIVGSDELIPVSAADAQGKPLHRIDDAAKEPVQVLAYSAESGLGRIHHALLEPAFARLPSHCVMTAHLASVLRTMALAGRGLAWLPASLIADDLAAGRLVVAAAEEWCIELEVVLYRDRATLGPAGEAFWQAAGTQHSTARLGHT